MSDAVFLCRRIKVCTDRLKKDRQEGSIVAKRHTRQLAVTLTDGLAYAAVVTAVYFVFANFEFGFKNFDIT